MSDLRVGDRFVLRTPALPTTYAAWAAAPDPRAYLAALVDEPAVREAIWVASPSLHDAIDAWRRAPGSAAGQRAERSLVKYVSRMMGRATPFGLFSAVSAGHVASATDLALAPRAEYRRRTCLDNDYLFVLADHLARLPEARARLAYRPNDSLYAIAGQLRYAVASVEGKDRSYQLVSVEPTPYLEATLARASAGATRAALAAPLVSDEISADEAAAYVDELIEAQLLVPELGVFITGPEPLDGLLAQLAAIELAGPHAVLAGVRAELAALDAGGVGAAPARYDAIARALEPLGVPVDRSRLFQVDMVKPAAATLAARVGARVMRAAAALARIVPRKPGLDAFITAFRERYEERSVPLAEALDEESGIGFESVRAPGAEGAPLLAGLVFPGYAPETGPAWTAREHHLLVRLLGAVAAGDQEIALDARDLAALAVPTPPPLPAAGAALVRLGAAGPRGEPEIMLEGISGPPGSRVLGRFAHASPEIAELVRAHVAAEEAMQPDARFAEIVHLNEGRIGNILCRPVLRAHEITVLGVSGAPRDAQLQVGDLMIAVRGNRIVLTSRRLGREVVPRLSTAHNFQGRKLGVYRFLCALAAQDGVPVSWSWGVLGGAPFLPRVRLDDVIVERARWRLDARELEPLTAAVRAARKDPTKQPDVLAAVAALRAARRLPRMLAVATGDNELPIDLDNPLLAAAFADEVAGPGGASLVEMFGAPEDAPAHGPEGRYANEVVVTFTRTDAPVPAPPPAPSPTTRRVLAPGSDWLYAKLYCGEATTDRVLRDAIAPVARDALAGGAARSWFFLRYYDPAPHVRVRFHGEPAALVERVLPALAAAAAPLVDGGVIHKWGLDTYERELERYGGDRGIALVEELFWRDSEAVLGIVELLEGAEGAIARWKLALRGIETLLEAVGLDPAARERLAAESRDRLGTEVAAGTPLWAKIGDRYTKERADLETVLARDPARDEAHDLQPGFAILAERDAAIAPIAAELRRRDAAGELSPALPQIAWSLAHMHANRLLHASQRMQEMVLYDFLRRWHAARRARAKP